MNIKKLNEELQNLFEDQYEGPDEMEQFYVTYSDGTEDNKFTLEDYKLLYNNKRFAKLIDNDDKKEISQKIIDYANKKLKKEVIEILDPMNQEYYKA